MDEEALAISSIYLYEFHSVTNHVPSSAGVWHADRFAPGGASIICAVDRAFGASLRGGGITDPALERVGTL
jgi:hypothetical protein